MNRLVVLASLLLMSCASVTVRPVEPSHHIDHVCIHENPKVDVADFMNVVRDGFDRHGISTEVVAGPIPTQCEYVLTYTAIRGWDFTPYLKHAELRLERGGRGIGYGEFHLTGGGGLDPGKWASTRTKMDPVIDHLLKDVGK